MNWLEALDRCFLLIDDRYLEGWGLSRQDSSNIIGTYLSHPSSCASGSWCSAMWSGNYLLIYFTAESPPHSFCEMKKESLNHNVRENIWMITLGSATANGLYFQHWTLAEAADYFEVNSPSGLLWSGGRKDSCGSHGKKVAVKVLQDEGQEVRCQSRKCLIVTDPGLHQNTLVSLIFPCLLGIFIRVDIVPILFLQRAWI